MRYYWLALIWLSAFAADTGIAQELPEKLASNPESEFGVRPSQRVLFFGDSITQAGGYVVDAEAYLLAKAAREGTMPPQVINHGISSETVSGTSEPDHNPRRPNAHDRFDRDVAAWNPDVVVACFGMNDGNYHPFDQERFERYQQGVRKLMDRVRAISPSVQLTILTPPPYDPYRRSASDPNAIHYGYKFAAIDYDHVLGKYAEWILSLRENRVRTIDLHDRINKHLNERRKTKASFYLAGDAVHPGPTGHWLMAQALLEGWGAQAETAHGRIDAIAMKIESGPVTELTGDPSAIRFVWTVPMPTPLDPQIEAESLLLEKSRDRFDQQTLKITGLNAARYRISADGAFLAEVNAGQLAQGLDLLGLEDYPPLRRSRDAFALIKQRRGRIDAAWRQARNQVGPGELAKTLQNDLQLEEILERCRPASMRIEITPIDESSCLNFD